MLNLAFAVGCATTWKFRSFSAKEPRKRLASSAWATQQLLYLGCGMAIARMHWVIQLPTLIPDLEELATPGRQVYICFDHDLKPSTLENVNLATKKLGKLLTQAECQVRVIQLPGPEKGVDDYVVAQGAEAFAHLYNSAVELDLWSSRKLWELTYKPSVTLNQRYLGDVSFPQSGFAFIKSPKARGRQRHCNHLFKQPLGQAAVCWW